MAREPQAMGAPAPAASAVQAASPAAPAPREAAIVEAGTLRIDPPLSVLFRRRWRTYQAGETAIFPAEQARELVAWGYGDVPGMIASPHRTLLVRK